MANYKINDNVFREYDIRGVVKEDFPENFLIDLGKAIGTIFLKIKEQNIAISGDLRNTTSVIKKILINGLKSTGMNVIDLGIIPTPVNYYSMNVLDNINCAIQITGSHKTMD